MEGISQKLSSDSCDGSIFGVVGGPEHEKQMDGLPEMTVESLTRVCQRCAVRTTYQGQHEVVVVRTELEEGLPRLSK